eukprot:m.414938 g.414938  ORF g.414938 m.414938 type:complete len:78 (+) comp29473_c0_seq1:1253-1486(+)
MIHPMGGCLPPDHGVPGITPSTAFRLGGMITEACPATRATVIIATTNATPQSTERTEAIGSIVQNIVRQNFKRLTKR